jgi:hypothetical protein
MQRSYTYDVVRRDFRTDQRRIVGQEVGYPNALRRCRELKRGNSDPAVAFTPVKRPHLPDGRPTSRD